ncbi:MAG: hypothetical protein PWP23_616 [Candidatus Sumerlaeota bacterium]|nr:hypothetical protein [Candidatus Sumerlaeota bacterium]
MNGINKTALALILGGALCATASPVRADRWYHSKGAWTTYGFAAGVVTGSLISDHHNRRPRYEPPRHYKPHHYRPRTTYRPPRAVYCPPPRRPTVVYESSPVVYRYSEPVVYRTEPQVVYRSEPNVVVVDSQPQPYQSYREESVWPFYRKVESEVIPTLPAPTGNSQAVSIADRYRTQSVAQAPAQNNQSPLVNITINSDKVDVQTGDQAVEEKTPETTTTGTSNVTTTRSNQAGLVRVTYSNRAGGQAVLPAAQMEENARMARDLGASRTETPSPTNGRHVDVSTTTSGVSQVRTVPSNASHGGAWY